MVKVTLKQQEITYLEQYNQAQLNYQRQLAEYEQRLTDKEFQITQVKSKLNNVDNAHCEADPCGIASLSQVKAPYGGTVRRIKWLGQSPDGSLMARFYASEAIWSLYNQN